MSNNTTQTFNLRMDEAVVEGFFVSVCVVGIFGNALVISMIALVKTMRTTLNFCLGCLAALDLLFLVADVMYFSLLLAESSYFDRVVCALEVMETSFIVCSHLIFLLIGVERYTLLCEPLKSLGWWTWKKVCLAMAIIFVFSVGVAVPYGVTIKYEYNASIMKGNETEVYCSILGNKWLRHYDTTVKCIASFLPIPVLIWLYGKIVIALRAKVPQRSHAQAVAARRPRGATKSNSKVIVMLVVIVAVFVICILPREILHLFSPDVFYSVEGISLDAMLNFSWALLLVNHTSNPFIYFLMSSSFRQAFKSVFCRCDGLNQGRVVEYVVTL